MGDFPSQGESSNISAWQAGTVYIKHLIDDLIKSIDELSIIVLSGEGDKEYFRFYRLIQALWREVRAIARHHKSQKDKIEEVDKLLFEMPKQINSFILCQHESQRLALKSDIISKFDKSYSLIWDVLVSAQLIVPLKPDIENLKKEDILAGLSVIHFSAEQSEEKSQNDKNNS